MLQRRRTYLLHCHSLAHKISSVKSSHSGIRLFASLHGHKPKPTRLTRMGIVHDLGFFHLWKKMRCQGHTEDVLQTYPPDFRKRLLQLARVDTVAEPRDMQVVARVLLASAFGTAVRVSRCVMSGRRRWLTSTGHRP